MPAPRMIALFLIAAAAVEVAGGVGFSQSGSGDAVAAQPTPIAVGDILSPDQVHIITEPGLYGLGRNVPGSEYAVAAGRLIRIEPETYKVLSILHEQSKILD